MPFSMTSYFLGVGTVVGALALGFGGGIVLTKTAIKDNPAPSRVERLAKAEPLPSPPQAAPMVTEAKAVPVPRADPPAEPAHVAATESKPAEIKPPDIKHVAEAARPEPAKTPEPVRQIDISKAAEQPVQAEAPKPAEPIKQAEAPK